MDATGVQQACELRMIRQDCAPFWARIEIVLKSAAAGGPAAYWITVVDISVQKHATEALRASEEKWHSLFEFLPVGVSIVDTRNSTKAANPALIAMLGDAEVGLLPGDHREGRYLRADRSPMSVEELPSVRALKEHQVIRDVEVGVEKVDGTIVWTSVSATPLPSGTQSAIVTLDITGRKRAEEALAASQAMYRLLAENSSDAVSLIDAEGKVVYSSPTSVQRLGYDEYDVVGLDISEILQRIHPDDRALITAEVVRGLELKLPTGQYEYRLMTKCGDYIWLEDSLRREFDDTGRQIRTIVNSRDITRRKQVEERLRASEIACVRYWRIRWTQPTSAICKPKPTNT
ncbi:MAG: PAS domain S-box protein [Anaerolineales bacterium]|nr:PAS domain S-box protein [Anaerolineales bacterium]